MTKKLRRLLLLVWMMTGLTGAARAQGPWARWYFGKQAGLHFAADSVAALPAGAMDSNEACATICDSTGALLFYSNGERIWTRRHLPMPGGDSLGGHLSSTQGCAIVPAPRRPGRYLVYTLDGIEHGLRNGLRVAEVDMSGRGDGQVLRKGEAVSIADSLDSPLNQGYWFTEKMTVVRHANGQDYWLVTHLWNSNTFISVRAGGALNDTATFVASAVGMVHAASPADRRSLTNASGWLTASPNGRLLACAVGDAGAELLDFDPATGRVGNARRLLMSFGGLHAYGVAFSPDGNLLYVSYMSLPNPFGAAQFVMQYDVRLPASQIGSSGIVVATQLNPIGALQCGPDGRIYVSSWRRAGLDRIEYPNLRGTSCMYHAQARPLTAGTNAWLGLPGRPNDAVRTSWLRAAADSACAGQPATLRVLEVPLLSALDTLVWDFGDGTTGRASALSTSHIYPAPGRYRVRVQLRHLGPQAEATTWVTVRPAGACTAPRVLIPNVITPNGDGLNDRFVLLGLTAADWHCLVFNRWGRQVYAAPRYANDWDAAGQPAGVYYYLLRNVKTGQQLNGTIQVVR